MRRRPSNDRLARDTRHSLQAAGGRLSLQCSLALSPNVDAGVPYFLATWLGEM